MTSSILQPVMALVLWTLVMWAWLYATRLPAIAKGRVKLDPNVPKAQMLAALPMRVHWKADNYNHLMEQPTLFYATALVLALTGEGEELNLLLAWSYVAIRVAHSLWQATVNVISVRFGLFMAGSLVLVALAVRAALTVFQG